MRDQVERFAERWSQLKPKDDVMEADSSVCAAALATVKDRKVELQQLMAEWEKLRWVCGGGASSGDTWITKVNPGKGVEESHYIGLLCTYQSSMIKVLMLER